MKKEYLILLVIILIAIMLNNNIGLTGEAFKLKQPSFKYKSAISPIIYPPKKIINQDPKGELEIADCNAFKGWACDPDDYYASLEVSFYDNQRFLGKVKADQNSNSGYHTCKKNRKHGFVFNTHNSLKDGLEHAIYVYTSETPTHAFSVYEKKTRQLLGSPKKLICNSSRSSFNYPFN